MKTFLKDPERVTRAHPVADCFPLLEGAVTHAASLLFWLGQVGVFTALVTLAAFCTLYEPTASSATPNNAFKGHVLTLSAHSDVADFCAHSYLECVIIKVFLKLRMGWRQPDGNSSGAVGGENPILNERGTFFLPVEFKTNVGIDKPKREVTLVDDIEEDLDFVRVSFALPTPPIFISNPLDSLKINLRFNRAPLSYGSPPQTASENHDQNAGDYGRNVSSDCPSAFGWRAIRRAVVEFALVTVGTTGAICGGYLGTFFLSNRRYFLAGLVLLLAFTSGFVGIIACAFYVASST